MLCEWHTYTCLRYLAMLTVGGLPKDVICPGCDQIMDRLNTPR